MNPLSPLVVFTLDEQHYALRLASVERVARRVELTPLPKAPEIVLGVINVQGRTIPVVNLRKRFGLAERELHLSEHIILAHTLKRAVVLVVDAVHGIIERSQQEVIAAEEILPGLDYLEAVTKLKEGLSESWWNSAAVSTRALSLAARVFLLPSCPSFFAKLLPMIIYIYQE